MAGTVLILWIWALLIAPNCWYLVLFLAIALILPTSVSTAMETPLACLRPALRNLSLQIALLTTALWQTRHEFVQSH